MTPNNPTTEELLLDETFLNFYFKKNEDDCIDWEERIEEDPALARKATEAFEMLERLSLRWSPADIEQRFARVQEALQQPSEPVLIYRKWKHIYRVAAAAAVLLLGVYGARMLHSIQYPKPDLAQNPTSMTQEWTQEQTGQSLRIFYLPDGTKVDLMPGSTLRQAPDFGQTQRLVYLEGTARFDVAKDKKRPFIVDAQGMRTTALGTVFMVSSGGKGQKASVALMEGRVKVEYRKRGNDIGQVVALDPGQQVMLEPERETFSPVFPLEAALTESWKKQQVLAFEKIRLEQVFRQLEVSYNVRFEGITPALANYQVSGDFDTRLPLTEVLEALAFSNDFNYVIHDKSTIQIYSN